ncbi:hypothetical protein CFOL_v3_32112 [Cephalotus follicularis]|uniref:Uncharacterized protein n=1 Tax=Cephalotus follicularis TaxID=3775 RepID=A0A1Q3D893_CEPFO|nr:hypothetical protein CFOL_v3_32112 [Cephalotus follicularis]
MVPNLDLILLALLYGFFIAWVLLIVIFVIMNGILIAFSLTLLSIALIDLQYGFSLVSQYYLTMKPNLELGFVVVLYMVLYYATSLILASKPSFEHLVSNFKIKTIHVMNRIDALVLIKTPPLCSSRRLGMQFEYGVNCR